ncbi:hypothetical protein EUGRSUZ_H00302 [Eucalyptus grandis]|uniref:Uncharacterized protein n=2 Tax=Eucalyptus grandis TaxID=71139 RepID=A0A059AUK7_EUCGR|nr:hypothetical protein EUGRSUZ_H00302 [Eucalyptus grandis]
MLLYEYWSETNFLSYSEKCIYLNVGWSFELSYCQLLSRRLRFFPVQHSPIQLDRPTTIDTAFLLAKIGVFVSSISLCSYILHLQDM